MYFIYILCVYQRKEKEDIRAYLRLTEIKLARKTGGFGINFVPVTVALKTVGIFSSLFPLYKDGKIVIFEFLKLKLKYPV